MANVTPSEHPQWILGSDDREYRALADYDERYSDAYVIDEIRIGRADVMLLAHNRLALNNQLFPNRDGHSAGAIDILHLCKPDLRPTQIPQHRDRLGESNRRLADVQQHPPVILQLAMREVEPAHIDPAVEELMQQPHVITRWTHGGDDLGANHAVAIIRTNHRRGR